MKYLLYRFPDVVKTPEPDENGDINFDFDFKDGVDEDNIKPTLVAVEFGDDIDDVARDLMQDVVDELSGTPEYRRCRCHSSAPKEPNNLEYLSLDFDYEMIGIVDDSSKEFNMLIYFGVLEQDE